MLPSKKELKERYALWSNRELLSVLHHKHEYTSEAVEVARAELGHRRVSADEVDQFLNDLERERKVKKILSGVSLTFVEKLRCFFFWFVPNVSVSRSGFHMKEKQSRLYSIAGYVCFFVSAFITIHFRLPYFLLTAILPSSFLIFYYYEKQTGNIDTLR